MKYFLFSFLLLLIVLLVVIKKKSIKTYALIVIMLLSTIAFNFKPTEVYDLYRHYSVLEMCRLYGFEYIINHKDYIALPVAAMYMYIISLLKQNGFLPAITSFIFYYCIIKTIDKMIKSEATIQKKAVVITLISFFFMFNYIGLISGIRNYLCFGIFFYFLYVDLIEEKNRKICFAIYFLLGLFHPSIWILTLLRLIVSCVKSETLRKIICFFLLIWSYLKHFIIIILSKFTNIPLIQLIVKKMLNYDSIESNLVANVPLYTFVYLTRNIIFLLIFLCYIHQYPEKKNKKYIVYLTYTITFVFGSLKEYHFFVRMSEFLLLLMIPIMITFFSGSFDTKGNNKKFLLQIAIIIESILFLIFFFIGQYSILI